MNTDIKALLQAVQNGTVSVDDALLELKQQQLLLIWVQKHC